MRLPSVDLVFTYGNFKPNIGKKWWISNYAKVKDLHVGNCTDKPKERFNYAKAKNAYGKELFFFFLLVWLGIFMLIYAHYDD